MAIKFDYKSPFGVLMPDCYLRVNHLFGGKSGVSVSASIYANSDAASNGSRHVTTFEYAFVPLLDGDNFIAQAYAHLKTLPEFEGAVEC